jgi:hypothetical protein
MKGHISDYIILRSNKDFIFKIPHPDFLKTDDLNSIERSLFEEVSLLDFNHSSEVVVFTTADNRIGFIGEAFTSWSPEKPPSLSIKLTNQNKVDGIHLLSMKPAKGPGFCTISLPPASEEFIIFFFTGSDSNWDFHFKKTDKVMNEISKFLNCGEVKVSTGYNS